MHDIIGDIHGHADNLACLLKKLGYKTGKNGYFHEEGRKVIFLCDFIDRGPKIKEVLDIAKAMVENGNALAVLGNHELNALAYNTPDPFNKGEFLRPHTSKNQGQIHETLNQLGNSLGMYLDWFRKLPLWLDFDNLRVIHACWDWDDIEKVKNFLGGNIIGNNNDFLSEAYRENDGSLFESIEHLLKGKEFHLPDGIIFYDHGEQPRTIARARWYLDPREKKYTYRQYAWQFPEIECDEQLDIGNIGKISPCGSHEKPVFIGHYWLPEKIPSLLAPNVACVDYSVAKEGFLCSYRHQGEKELSNKNFVW